MATITKEKPVLKSRHKPVRVRRSVRPFVEHPAPPLGDADRDVFLAFLNSDDEPNDALRAAAGEFKGALRNS